MPDFVSKMTGKRDKKYGKKGRKVKRPYHESSLEAFDMMIEAENRRGMKDKGRRRRKMMQKMKGKK